MMVFFIFHCFYPNKQERFILPFIPFFIIVGLVGWGKIQSELNVKPWVLKFEKFSWGMFIVLKTMIEYHRFLHRILVSNLSFLFVF